MKRLFASLVVLALGVGLMVGGCTQAAPAPTPTKAPAAPTKAPEPTKPAAATAAPTKAPEATKAPTAPPAAPTAAPAKKVDFPGKGRAASIILPFATGGSTDIATRQLAQVLEKELGGTFEVVNKAGGTSQVALTELARAKADGYTLGIFPFVAGLISYLDPERKAIYTRKSFQPISMFVADDDLIVVKPDSPHKDVKDLVAAAKANPEKIIIADGGIMSNTHIAVLALERVAGIKFGAVHFDSTGACVTAVLGGHAEGCSGSSGGVFSFVKNNSVRVLGTTGKEPNRFYPGVKTYLEQGYKVEMVYSFGLVGPAGVPKEIVEVLDAAMRKVLATGEMKGKLNEMAVEPFYMNPSQFETYWANYEDQVKPLIDMAKAQTK